ncbi:ADP-ribosylglycohydrolase family protein [Aquimarina addita]|uniref:ADP-ribosylglycohydrolase family protein n=1 Tax=Aquimarina addita TaxID=870485 RepID=A0ABP7X8S5_9FLAO
MLIGGIADAYGAGFEFAPETVIVLENNLKQYRAHPKYTCIHRKYTDDTQMAIAITELVLNEENWTDISIANKFVEVFKRDPRRGYSSRFYTILSEVKTGRELIESLTLKSNRNGAAMRSYPIGVYQEETLVMKKTMQQAKITHDTKEGIVSAQIIALAAHYFMYKKGEKKQLREYLEHMLSLPFHFKRESTLKMEAIPTVTTVMALVLEYKSMSACVKEAVSLGGDTDTVASLALSILSLCNDTINDLPAWMYLELENNSFGSDYLISLDKQLLNTIKL